MSSSKWVHVSLSLFLFGTSAVLTHAMQTVDPAFSGPAFFDPAEASTGQWGAHHMT